MRHVARCDHCATEVAAYARAQNRLRHTFYRVTCPPAEDLGDYELGLVSEAERVAIARHALDCPRCAEELHVLREFLQPAPDTAPVRVGVVERLARVIATALAPPLPSSAGVLRGTAGGASRSYRAGSLAISITVRRGPSGDAAIVGLVWDNDDAEAELMGEVRLVGEGDTTHTSAIDELGNFSFEGVTPGLFQLELTMPRQVVVVEDLLIEGP